MKNLQGMFKLFSVFALVMILSGCVSTSTVQTSKGPLKIKSQDVYGVYEEDDTDYVVVTFGEGEDAEEVTLHGAYINNTQNQDRFYKDSFLDDFNKELESRGYDERVTAEDGRSSLVFTNSSTGETATLTYNGFVNYDPPLDGMDPSDVADAAQDAAGDAANDAAQDAAQDAANDAAQEAAQEDAVEDAAQAEVYYGSFR